jgi:hypothetical protein
MPRRCTPSWRSCWKKYVRRSGFKKKTVKVDAAYVQTLADIVKDQDLSGIFIGPSLQILPPRSIRLPAATTGTLPMFFVVSVTVIGTRNFSSYNRAAWEP